MSSTEQFVIFMIMIVGVMIIVVLNDYISRRSARRRATTVDSNKERDKYKTSWPTVIAMLIGAPLLFYISQNKQQFGPFLQALQFAVSWLPIAAITLLVAYIAIKVALAYWRQRHASKAFRLVNEGDSVGAIRYLEQQMRKNGRTAPLLHTLAVVYGGQKNLDDGMSVITEAEALSPNDAQIQDLKGLLLRQQGHLEEAIESLRKAHALAPNVLVFATNLGDALVAAGNFDEARQMLAKSEEIFARCVVLGAKNRKRIQEQQIDPLKNAIASGQSNPS